MENKKTSHLVAGGVLSGFLILYSVVLMVLEQFENTSLSWISYGIMALILTYFIRQHGKENEYKLSFGALFSYGFKASAFTTIILLAFQVVFNMAFPEMREKILQIAMEKMSQDPRVTEEAMDMGVAFLKKTFWPLVIAGTLFSTLFFGAIGSLIGAAITRKNPTTPFS